MTTSRRSPRYLRFLATGGVLGLLAAGVVTLVRGDSVARPAVLFFYLAILLVGVGLLLGAVAAVAMEARRR